MGIRCYLEDGEEQYMMTCDRCGKMYGYNRPTVEKLKIWAEEQHGWSVTINPSRYKVLCPECKPS